MPDTVVVGNHLGQRQRTINFNVKAIELDGETHYEYNSVTLPPGTWDYDSIIDALVSEIYPNDKMWAVVNNYLGNPNDEAVVAEYNEMQEWRERSKALATKLLESATHN